jgi:hypothetical protein
MRGGTGGPTPRRMRERRPGGGRRSAGIRSYCEFCTDYAAKIARPAMIVRVRRADTGEPTGGIHRTYLLEDGHSAKGGDGW